MRGQLEKWVRSKRCYLYLLVVTAMALFWARRSGSKVGMPVAMILAMYPVYLFDLSQGRRDLAVSHTLFWVFFSSVLMIYFVRQDAARMSRLVFNGAAYRDEMFQWILTGQGAEGSIRLFLPQHLKHFALLCVSSLLTGGLWGLALGAVLVNYMNFYVGSLLFHARRPLLVLLLGWPIWSLFRVAGFVFCGVALSEPLLSQLFRFRPDFRRSFPYFLWGLVFILIDILLKATLASFWRDLLRRAVSF